MAQLKTGSTVGGKSIVDNDQLNEALANRATSTEVTNAVSDKVTTTQMNSAITTATEGMITNANFSFEGTTLAITTA